MAVDPNTGVTTPDPTTQTTTPTTVPDPTGANPSSTPTADKVNGLLSQGNPYIEQAKSAGMDVANSRGLQNSSIAAGESQKAAYSAAVPIATNDANIGAQKDLQASQIASTEKIATAQNVTQTTIAGMNIDASAKQQAAAILSQEKIASEQITSAADLAKLQSDTQKAIAQMNIDDADKQQLLALAEQQRQADQTAATQLQIANMNVSSNQQDKAQAAAVSYANTYASMVNSINSNANIPADARAAYLQNAKTLYDNGMSLVEQTYNVTLDWGQNVASVDSSAGAAYGGSSTATNYPSAPAAPAWNGNGFNLNGNPYG